MEITRLSSQYYVCEQISVDDLNVVAAQGFKSIVNNRPDDEAEGQPRSDELAAVAAELDIEYMHIPVIAGSITENDVDDFEHACKNLAGPVLLFCRTGARSTMLWKLSTAG